MLLLLEIIDRLALERGEKNGHRYSVTVTTAELMSPLGLKPSVPHHRYVKGMVETHYPGTRVEPVGLNGSGGFRLHIKIWSK